MFIPRMWSDEVERIGKQRCTLLGYTMQGFGELVGFIGLFMLVGVPLYFTYAGFVGTFYWSLLWMLTVPFVIGIVGRILVALSWWLALRKDFRYDYQRRESSWIEAGEKRYYTFRDWEATEARRNG